MSTEDDRIRQLQGTLHLLQTGVDRASHRVEEMHLAIAKKPFGILRLLPVVGLASGVIEKIHDGVTHGVHLAIRGANEVALTTAIKALDFAKTDGPPDVDHHAATAVADPDDVSHRKPVRRPRSRKNQDP